MSWYVCHETQYLCMVRRLGIIMLNSYYIEGNFGGGKLWLDKNAFGRMNFGEYEQCTDEK